MITYNLKAIPLGMLRCSQEETWNQEISAGFVSVKTGYYNNIILLPSITCPTQSGLSKNDSRRIQVLFED